VFHSLPQVQNHVSSFRGDQPQSGQRMRGGSKAPGFFSSSSPRSGTRTGLSATGLMPAIMNYEPCYSMTLILCNEQRTNQSAWSRLQGTISSEGHHATKYGESSLGKMQEGWRMKILHTTLAVGNYLWFAKNLIRRIF
jgi:hypothetical protein